MIDAFLKKKNSSEMYAWFLTLFLNEVLIVDLIRMLTNGSVFTDCVKFGLYIICAIYIYYYIFFINKLKKDKQIFFIGCTIFLVILISYFACPKIITTYGYFIPFILSIGFPGIFFTYYSDKQKISLALVYLEKYRFLWMLYALTGMIWVPTHTINNYSTTFGANLLIPTCILFYYFLKTMKVKYILYGLGLSIFMFLWGPRTPLLCLFIYTTLSFVLIHRKNYKYSRKTKFIVLITVFIIVSILVLPNIISIATYLFKYFPTSRFLKGFTINLNEFDSGRLKIQAYYWKYIKQHPFKFSGIFSDRIYYTSARKVKYSITNHPHNLMIELFFQFGIPIGFIFFVFILVKMVKSLWLCIKKDDCELIGFLLILCVSGFLYLLFSGSYLIWSEFYLLIGFVLSFRKANL